ncbi:hypothetical protein DEO72_LG6g833 [Vigna unguiculata]|uniref:Uncharacterized protein n=1 Tax=Vigna unguiculata TaxID=3917 RepID=A0A4D6M6V1_VIGUN|nr:hypothetical protein DEO72_LG6g833 [Vigna unguiculata]
MLGCGLNNSLFSMVAIFKVFVPNKDSTGIGKGSVHNKVVSDPKVVPHILVGSVLILKNI